MAVASVTSAHAYREGWPRTGFLVSHTDKGLSPDLGPEHELNEHSCT